MKFGSCLCLCLASLLSLPISSAFKVDRETLPNGYPGRDEFPPGPHETIHFWPGEAILDGPSVAAHCKTTKDNLGMPLYISDAEIKQALQKLYLKSSKNIGNTVWGYSETRDSGPIWSLLVTFKHYQIRRHHFEVETVWALSKDMKTNKSVWEKCPLRAL